MMKVIFLTTGLKMKNKLKKKTRKNKTLQQSCCYQPLWQKVQRGSQAWQSFLDEEEEEGVAGVGVRVGVRGGGSVALGND